ncbi:MAG: flagellar biosynthetic protein FliO [Granulosicoccus sp.]
MAQESPNPGLSPGMTLLKLATGLLVVLLVFWVFARVMRQLHGPHGHAHKALRVIASLGLGQRERIVVIQVGDEQLVLGVTANQINTLHVLQGVLDQNTELHAESFREKLSAALKRENGG